MSNIRSVRGPQRTTYSSRQPDSDTDDETRERRLEQQQRETAAAEQQRAELRAAAGRRAAELAAERLVFEQQRAEQKLPEIEAKVVLSTIEDKINHFQKKHQECQLLMNEQGNLLKDIVDQSKKEKEARNNKETCVVCMDEKRTHIIMPCGHYCLCEECAEKINKGTGTKKCPICRGSINSFSQVFKNKYLKYKMKYLKLKK